MAVTPELGWLVDLLRDLEALARRHNVNDIKCKGDGTTKVYTRDHHEAWGLIVVQGYAEATVDTDEGDKRVVFERAGDGTETASMQEAEE